MNSITGDLTRLTADMATQGGFIKQTTSRLLNFGIIVTAPTDTLFHLGSTLKKIAFPHFKNHLIAAIKHLALLILLPLGICSPKSMHFVHKKFFPEVVNSTPRSEQPNSDPRQNPDSTPSSSNSEPPSKPISVKEIADLIDVVKKMETESSSDEDDWDTESFSGSSNDVPTMNLKDFAKLVKLFGSDSDDSGSSSSESESE